MGSSVVLLENSVYAFDVTADIASWGDTRFEIQFAAATLNTNLTMASVNNCDNDFVTVSLDNSQVGVSYDLMNANTILGTKLGNGGQIEFVVLKSSLIEGLNNFDVVIDNGSCGNAKATDAISVENIAVSEVTSVQEGDSCGENNVTISATGAPTNGYYHWYESIDAISPIVGENASSYITPLQTTTATYFVSVVNSSGCESAKIAVEAIIIDFPTSPQVTGGAECRGSVVLLTAIGGVDGNYRWYTSPDLSSAPISGEVNSVFETVTAGDYFVSIVNSNGCESDRILVTSTIYEVPIAEISDNGNILSSSSLTGNQWYKDGMLIDGAISNEYEVTSSGSYSVNVTNGQCSETSIERVMQITALNETSFAYDEILIYPNPVGNEDLTVNFDSSQEEFKNAIVLDNSGRMIKNIEIDKSDSDLKINFNEYENGIYYIKLIGVKSKFIYKVLKH